MLGGGFVDIVTASAFGGEVTRRFKAEVERGGAFWFSKHAGLVRGCGGEGGFDLFLAQIERVLGKRAVAA